MQILVAQHLKELMREEHLSQTDLAYKIEVAQNTISAWLSEKKLPSLLSLWALADYFDVSVDYLIGRQNF